MKTTKILCIVAMGMMAMALFMPMMGESSAPSMPIIMDVDKEVIQNNITPTNADASDICFNTHNNHAYYTMLDGSVGRYKIGAMDESGDFENYTLNGDMRIMWGGDITFNSHDNCVYFMEKNETLGDYYIGKMTEAGVITDYALPEDHFPIDICFDSNENKIYGETSIISNHSYWQVFSMTEAGSFTLYDLFADKVFEGEIVFNTNDNNLYFDAHPASNSTIEIIKMSEDGMTFNNYTLNLDYYTPTLLFNENDNCVYGRALNETSAIKMYKMTEGGDFTIYDFTEQVGYWCFSNYDNYFYAGYGSSNPHYFRQISEIGIITNYTFNTTEEFRLMGLVANSHNGDIYAVGQNGDTSNGSIFVLTDIEQQGTGDDVAPQPQPPHHASSSIDIIFTRVGDWTTGKTGVTASTGVLIPIEVIITSTKDIMVVTITITETNNAQSTIALSITSGTLKNGVWSCNLPSQSTSGNLYYTVAVLDVSGHGESTDQSYIVVSPSAPTLFGFDVFTIGLIAIGLILLVVAGFMFARK